MQNYGNYGLSNAAGGYHQEFLIDSEDEPPETDRINLKKQILDEPSLKSSGPLTVSVGIASPTPSSPSSASSADHHISSDHSNQHSPAPSSPHSAHGQCVLNSELHEDLKAFNETMQKADFTPSSPHHPSLPGERMPILGKSFSWVSAKLQARTTKTGCGLFCIEPIKKGEYLVVWTGRIVSAEEALSVMDTNEKHYILQIGDGFYQTPLQSEREAADLSNHSCEPTAGFGANSPIALTAVRDLSIGEEVVFDYGMCETDERLWEPMDCACGSKYCRGSITANDWKREDLWERYEGLWAPHVQKLVNQEKQQRLKINQKTNNINNNNNSVEATATTVDVHPSNPKEDIAYTPKSSNHSMDENDIGAAQRRRRSSAKPSPVNIEHEHEKDCECCSTLPGTHGTGYYKAAPSSSHWFGKMIYPWIDAILAKVGLARVTL